MQYTGTQTKKWREFVVALQAVTKAVDCLADHRPRQGHVWMMVPYQL